MIKKLLIANRGEIAVRIIRACKELNISTVAIYSEVDQSALHVRLADEAICVGKADVQSSYLNKENIITAAMLTNCDAIHPGFGFLSENAKFAKLVEQCGLIFIGPSHEIIEKMGDKASARSQMIIANVPVVPGSEGILRDVDEGKQLAIKIGYPVLIKATSGGGGRGMRIVEDESSFEELYNEASLEAYNAFGDGRCYLEKFINNPKHIEIQVVGDQHGNYIHLFERDCSVQRRNQKLIEEAPCIKLKETVRKKMCEASIRACKQVGYNSVGTIEFLYDGNEEFYFIEMNTRIQVEHPITEMVTQIDLLKLQIKIAGNHKIPYKQEDIVVKGHAIECRINAENFKESFRPSPGKIKQLHFPGGNGIRVDSAIYAEYEIPAYYDSLIVKLIAYAPTRLEAIRKMRGALEEFIIDGIDTNMEFHYYILHSKKFIEGRYTTGFVNEFLEELKHNGTII